MNYNQRTIKTENKYLFELSVLYIAFFLFVVMEFFVFAADDRDIILMEQNSIILNTYISTGLHSNLALQQKEFILQKSVSALDEAKSLFYPSIDLNARYTRADGGRSIDVPVGDLVNPAYTALNSILSRQVFPTNVPNQSYSLMLEKEYETKVSILQPLFKPEILYNYKIKSNLTDIAASERSAYARRLVADIKTAYFNYLKALNAKHIFEKIEQLLNENLRVSNSLFKNNKVTKDAVYRAEAELSELILQKIDALKNVALAKSYFNFLLNRPLDAEIETDDKIADPAFHIKSLLEYESTGLNNREELKQLQAAIQAGENSIRLYKSNYLPGLFFAADYGFQDEAFPFQEEDEFWTASIVLKWNLFQGFGNKAKTAQAQWEKKKLESQVKELENQIRLQINQAYQNLLVAEQSVKAAHDQTLSAEKSFEIVEKKYNEGMAPLIEYVDSRTAMTRAAITDIVKRYDYYIKDAELEWAIAAYPIDDIHGEQHEKE